MSYYFLAACDRDALAAQAMPGGPMAGNDRYDAIDEAGIMATPHLDQLVELASGQPYRSSVAELVVLDPAADAAQEWEPGRPSIQRLPDRLRDDLAGLAIDAAAAARWSQELWGVEPDEARARADEFVAFARRALESGRHIYWWMEL